MITLQINTRGSWKSVADFNPSDRAAILDALPALAKLLGSAAEWCLRHADGKREWLTDIHAMPALHFGDGTAEGVSIDDAGALCRDRGLTQAILLTCNGSETRVTTFGTSDQDSAIAAEAGNRIKRWLGWPEAMCRAESAKVTRLHDRIAELEAQVGALNASTLTRREG